MTSLRDKLQHYTPKHIHKAQFEGKGPGFSKILASKSIRLGTPKHHKMTSGILKQDNSGVIFSTLQETENDRLPSIQNLPDI